ncbi:ubiquinol-cytochrome c reductase iron-sulfur subunit [Deinococcus aquaticus]|uniref:QcrA and Rieske domain-containing protein n=1 Tax=Deinococcus aquaticus TaxID=328692 RepID=UPI003F4644E2
MPGDPTPAPVRRLTRRALLDRWWLIPVAGTAGAFGYMGWYATRVMTGKRTAGTPDFRAALPARVAALSDLSGEWAERTFTYAGRPCTVLRVPQDVPGALPDGGSFLIAYSRVCTHLGCNVNLVRDPEILAFAFNYRPPRDEQHPQLGCRCHYSVFDPLRAGEAVFGKALLPLPRVQLQRRGADLWATGIEPAPDFTG